jgi:translation initiation factor IF-3
MIMAPGTEPHICRVLDYYYIKYTSMTKKTKPLNLCIVTKNIVLDTPVLQILMDTRQRVEMRMCIDCLRG